MHFTLILFACAREILARAFYWAKVNTEEWEGTPDGGIQINIDDESS